MIVIQFSQIAGEQRFEGTVTGSGLTLLAALADLERGMVGQLGPEAALDIVVPSGRDFGILWSDLQEEDGVYVYWDMDAMSAKLEFKRLTASE